MASSEELSKKYQKKSDKEHVLDNPDTYIGSIEKISSNVHIYDEATHKIVEKQITYIPGLYKLFDEGIVNCRDHVIRMEQLMASVPSLTNDENNYPVTKIDISIDDTGVITLTNDGNGIDVSIHPEYKVWIPELIFANLRTSTNYVKEEKKIVGGKNGFGFKLVLIWSTWGKIETVDAKTGQKYIQEFKDNLNIIEKPKITKCKSKPYTSVSFKPDFKRLGIEGFDKDFIALLRRRVYDIAAVTNKSIKVKYNSTPVEIKTFMHYIDLYIGTKADKERIYEQANERWEYAVCLAPNEEFSQVSFVNGIFTSKGGKHVEYIVNQIVRKLTTYIKEKKHIDVKPASIKEQLMIFVNCTIENPAFDSQTKDYLNSAVSNFGSACEVSSKFIEKLAKMGVMATACNLTEVKENKALKKSDGTKCKTIRNIPKLVDANFAGTAKSSQCVLILCEGDSAKSGIISGLSREDRNFIGVYPMKGKMFNIRGESIGKIGENKEISEIKQIVGLEHGKTYTLQDVNNKLRYGKLLFMTDQDLDGSHIKGLAINMIESEWSSLIEIPEFIGYMNTPILKATYGKEVIPFYNNGEYEQWKKENSDFAKWTIKYYKGLGTSTSKEFKEYFANKKIVNFTSVETCKESIDKVFNKKRANDRKEWLSNYDRSSYLNTSKPYVTYGEFINNDMIHFSIYDNERSIPNICDGLKICLRKILFAALKKKLTSEIKVAQFSGYVSEQSCYHHGEASLNGAIIGLAQNFVGSNNINLFKPEGQFGTRLQGGKDAASERYIFTYLNPITRKIFSELDDAILDYIDDDGSSVEPIYYVPIIPMILVNGTKGIGTGFSTDIMCYNPIQIISYLEAKLNNVSNKALLIEPYYQGFKGKIYPCDATHKKYIIKGCYETIGPDKIRISELPVGTWTQDYKEFLEGLLDTKSSKSKSSKANDEYVKDFVDMSTDITVDFEVTFYPGILSKLVSEDHDYSINGLEKYLKLYTSQCTTNMHLFNEKEQLNKYDNVYEIVDSYYTIRYDYYAKRKKYIIERIERELKVLSNKARFIQYNLDDKIDLRKKSKDAIYKIMEDFKFDLGETHDYNYLVKMPMDSVCKENVEKLLNEHELKKNELATISACSLEHMWLKELDALKSAYSQFLESNIKSEDKSKKSKKTK
uniref:DNA topoisomerase (ATP-hydrolyzing) n=1 Tax=viral metagenome TaxID=1070528 RepID=A0A6C0D4W6_9ZZZZ